MVKIEDMEEKIQCLHQNWGKLYIGLGSGDIVAWNLNVSTVKPSVNSISI